MHNPNAYDAFYKFARQVAKTRADVDAIHRARERDNCGGDGGDGGEGSSRRHASPRGSQRRRSAIPERASSNTTRERSLSRRAGH